MPYADPEVRRLKQRERTARYRARHKPQAPSGACSGFPSCKNKTEGKFKQCASCRKYRRDRHREERKQDVPEGVCSSFPDCKNPARKNRKNCVRCAERSGERQKRRLPQITTRNHEIAREVFAAYGNACACCGEAEFELLTIDHIEPWSGKSPRKGHALYRYIKREDFPPDFRVLCFNCNFCLGHRGYCPHGDLTQKHYWSSKKNGSSDLKTKEKRRKYWLKYKADVLSHYGPLKCACCAEKNLELLTLDHLDNNGAEHRRKQPKSRNLYIWLRRNDYPKGYEVCCLNCNHSRSRVPEHVCVHQRA
jgi:hypothetical protein